MSMVSRGVKAGIQTITNHAPVAGKIPPAPTRAVYQTADFASQPAPANTGGEPGLQGGETLKKTMASVAEAYPVKAPKE